MQVPVVLLFPGQGSQYMGMGQIFEGQEGEQWRERIDRAVGYPLSRIMLEGPEEKLTLTANAQPAIVAHSMVLFQRLQIELAQMGATIEWALGHSVGEYAALCAAGAMELEDALQAVHWRGQFMQEAVPVGEGTMVAVLKIPAEIVEEACRQCSRPDSQVMPANYNTPEQTVISGHTAACRRAVEWLKDTVPQPHRCVQLSVSAPFHSGLMSPAADRLVEKLDQLKSWRSPRFPYIANVDAKPYSPSTEPATIRDNLYRQVARPVLWTQSVEQLPPHALCIEVGPGQTLAGMMRKMRGRAGGQVVSLDGEQAFQKLRRALEEAHSERVATLAR